jgi:hypothetical protein
MTAPAGDTLSKDKAYPFVVSFEMVDTDKDGDISQTEFQTGCGKGWIQKSDATPNNGRWAKGSERTETMTMLKTGGRSSSSR